MQKTRVLPSAITTSRIAAIPFTVYFLNEENFVLFWTLFLFSAGTDFLDGYIARKFNTTSKAGAYYDVIADFGLITGIFIIFTMNGIYPPWILAIIVISFALFMITSLYGTQIYDPVGKYWGALLYAVIALTILFKTEAFPIVAQLLISGFFVASMVSRVAWFAGNSHRKKRELP